MMYKLIQAIPLTFAALFPVLNPLGGAFIFLSLTQFYSERERNRLALQVGINTAILLTVVLVSGSWILRFFGITIPIVQIGGGLVVAYIGWTLLHQSQTPQAATPAQPSAAEKSADEMAFFPLTMPITAGPGCIAVTLTMGAHEVSSSLVPTVMGQAGAIVGIILGALTVFFCYRYANGLIRLFGKSGTQVTMRLAAFVNLCIGLEIVWHGIQGLA